MLERVGNEEIEPASAPNLTVVDQPPDSPKQIDWNTNAKITGGLVLAGAASFLGERYGVNKELPPLIKQSADSMAHPMLGYAGGMAVAVADAVGARLRGAEMKAKAYGVAATLTTVFFNTDAEVFQSGRTSWQYDPLSSDHIGESAKDAGFAALGLGLFYALNRRRDLQRLFPKRFIRT